MRKAHGLGVFFMTALMSYLEISDCSEPCRAQEVVISPSEVLTLLNRQGESAAPAPARGLAFQAATKAALREGRVTVGRTVWREVWARAKAAGRLLRKWGVSCWCSDWTLGGDRDGEERAGLRTHFPAVTHCDVGRRRHAPPGRGLATPLRCQPGAGLSA